MSDPMLNLPLEDGRLAGVVAFCSLIHLQAVDRPQVYAQFAREVCGAL
ncbi:class I SAM-dependent methyltransferase [Streptomyces caniferus]